MPNETRPRRESTGNPRPRRTVPSASDTAAASYPSSPTPADALHDETPTVQRDHGERLPTRPEDRVRESEGPRNRERDGSGLTRDRNERDRYDRERDASPPASSLRDRLVRDRAERLARQQGVGSPPSGESVPMTGSAEGREGYASDPGRPSQAVAREPRRMVYDEVDYEDGVIDDDIFGDAEIHDRYEDIKRGEIYLTELQRMTMPQLIATAKAEGITEYTGLKKQDLIFKILKERVKHNGLMYGEGTLEVLPDGFGFLRSPDYNYLPCPDDIYVSPSQIRRFGLKTGAIVSGQIRPPKENERYFALLRVEMINFEEPDKLSEHVGFDDLSASHPSRPLVLEHEGDPTLRLLDLIAPIGKGQRGLIVAPPRSGKSTLVQKLAQSLLANHPEIYVMVLLIDERPEEVTAMEQLIKNPSAEVISSTFDEPAARHIQVAEMVIEKAKRMVEYGKDVVIILDSITHLARAYNTEASHTGKLLGAGIDPTAIQKPKRFFGAARSIEEAGSLAILATAHVESGTRLDELVLDEFRGTGNMELYLDRRLVDRRVWPAIDVHRSGTRREELFADAERLPKVELLRRALGEMDTVEAVENLCERFQHTATNQDLLKSLNFD